MVSYPIVSKSNVSTTSAIKNKENVHIMSNVLNQQQLDLAEQLKELVKVGVGGKFKDT